jgi:hypothetical protein
MTAPLDRDLHRRIDVAPLREAFLSSGLSASELCVWLEWFKPNGTADTSRLMRALGLLPSMSRGENRFARSIGVDRAALIADALGLDPWEAGL